MTECMADDEILAYLEGRHPQMQLAHAHARSCARCQQNIKAHILADLALRERFSSRTGFVNWLSPQEIQGLVGSVIRQGTQAQSDSTAQGQAGRLYEDTCDFLAEKEADQDPAHFQQLAASAFLTAIELRRLSDPVLVQEALVEFDLLFADPTLAGPGQYLAQLQEWHQVVKPSLAAVEPPSRTEEEALFEKGFHGTADSTREGAKRIGRWMLDAPTTARIVKRFEDEFKAHVASESRPHNFFVRLAATRPVRLDNGRRVPIRWFLFHPLPAAASAEAVGADCVIQMPTPDRMQILAKPGEIQIQLGDHEPTRVLVPETGIVDLTSVSGTPIRMALESCGGGDLTFHRQK